MNDRSLEKRTKEAKDACEYITGVVDELIEKIESQEKEIEELETEVSDLKDQIEELKDQIN